MFILQFIIRLRNKANCGPRDEKDRYKKLQFFWQEMIREKFSIYQGFSLLHYLQAKQYEMLTFVRHGQSLFNAVVEDYIKEHNIGNDWVRMHTDKNFGNQIKYAYQYLDCTITEKGVEECMKARQELEGLKPDLILVSPLERTLKTCDLIFGGMECPVIAEPLLSESLRSICDFGGELDPKKIKYPYVNFQNVEKAGQFWFIDNQSKENKEKYYEVMAKNENKDFTSKMKAIFQFLKEALQYQSATNLRRRTEKLRELLKEYGKTYKNIAIVCHYNIIRYTLAKEFNEKDEPYHSTIKNCEVVKAQLNSL